MPTYVCDDYSPERMRRAKRERDKLAARKAMKWQKIKDDFARRRAALLSAKETEG